MVRDYLPDPIDRETIEKIVGTVRRAPSGGFSQGHRLVVVTDAEMRRALAGLAGEAEYVALGHKPWISTAPVHIVVCTREESYHERYRKDDKLVDGEEISWPAPYWYVDAGSMFMLLQLAALAEGLGTGVYGVPGEAGRAVEGAARAAGGHRVRLRRDDRQAAAAGRRHRSRLPPDAGAQATRRAGALGALGRDRRLASRTLRSDACALESS